MLVNGVNDPRKAGSLLDILWWSAKERLPAGNVTEWKRNESVKEVIEGEPDGQRDLREVCPGFAEPQLGRQLDEIEEERLLWAGCGDRAEMRILHHPMALDQRIDHIAASETTVAFQPHGVKTFLKVE